MKKLLSICLVTLSFAGIYSCKKGYLDQVPQDRITIQEVFAHKNTVDQYLANVYSYVRDEANQRFAGGTNGGGPWPRGFQENAYDWWFLASQYINVRAWDPTTTLVNDFLSEYYTPLLSSPYFIP